MVLTSETVLARLFLCKEWKNVKTLKKKDLIEKMIASYGFADDIQTKKLPELKQLAEQHLLEREKELVGVYEKELDKVTVLLPTSIATFFQCALPVSEEDKREIADVADEHDTFEEMQEDILAFLARRMNDDEAAVTAEDESLLTTLLLGLS